jgi:hypothetical protein
MMPVSRLTTSSLNSPQPCKWPSNAYTYPDIPPSFNFISSEQELRDVVFKEVKQELRTAHIIDAIKLSSTPVTMEQVQHHLRVYKGRPKEAQDHIKTELCDLHTVPSPQEELSVFQTYSRAVDRMITIAGNQKMHGLSSMLQKVQAVSVANSDQDNPVMRRLEQRCLLRGLWEIPVKRVHRGGSDETQLNSAHAALLLRVEAIESVLTWSRSATVVQCKQRMHVQRVRYIAERKLRRDSATMLQLAWLTNLARKHYYLMIEQRVSEWEEIWSPDEQLSYFFHKPTKGSIWHVPTYPPGHAKEGQPVFKGTMRSRFCFSHRFSLSCRCRTGHWCETRGLAA